MLQLITAVFRYDHSALLAWASLYRGLKHDRTPPDFALLNRRKQGGFSLIEIVELASPLHGKEPNPTFWRSLADILVGSSGKESADAGRLAEYGIGMEYRRWLQNDIPRGGGVILMLVTNNHTSELASSIMRGLGGEVKTMPLSGITTLG